jgi:hypothetical protein
VVRGRAAIVSQHVPRKLDRGDGDGRSVAPDDRRALPAERIRDRGEGRRNFWKITLGAARREDHDFYLMHAVQSGRIASQEIRSSLGLWTARPARIAGGGWREA